MKGIQNYFKANNSRIIRYSKELDFAIEPNSSKLLEIHRKLIALNKLVDGSIYTQITRGNARDRDFLFPPIETPPTVVVFTQVRTTDIAQMSGKAVVTMEDLRWHRSDIKTVQLLFASVAKRQAVSQGADDAWLVRDGMVTEGTSNNAFIVTQDGKLVTRHLSSDILPGITRKAILECAAEAKLDVQERPFSVREAKQAKEAFSTSAITIVTPVTSIDGSAIGNGRPGPIAGRLREIYLRRAKEDWIV
jgi:D-alanine transaminase